MNIFNIDFEELFQRHLCRHGQLGINVWHIVAVYGIYFSICSLALLLIRDLTPPMPILSEFRMMCFLFTPYLIILVPNVPFTVFSLTFVSILFLAMAAILTPATPIWLHLLLIPMWHRVQLLSHRRYTLQRDMSPFAAKYKKGTTLFLILAVYELPILLRYFLYGQESRAT